MNVEWQFVQYDIEQPYKADEGGNFAWSEWLVELHARLLTKLPVAVNSYGAFKSSIDFGAFARAGWPVFAQCYDSFSDGDEQTYRALFPPQAIHRLVRRRGLLPGEWVYRPESLD